MEMKQLTRDFPNGFENWVQTYYEVTSTMHFYLSKSEEIWPARLKDEFNRFGSISLVHLAVEIADEFETLHSNTIWDSTEDENGNTLSFWETINEFTMIKLR